MPGRPQDFVHLYNYAVKEATYGAGTAEGAIFPKLVGPGLVKHTKAEDTDADEITGHPYLSQPGDIIEDRVSGSIEFKTGIDLLTLFIAALNGNVTTAGTTNYTHTVLWPGSGVAAPFSFSVVQFTDRNDTLTREKFHGVFPNSIEIALANPGPIISTVELMGDGSVVAASVSAPAINAATEEKRVMYEHINTFAFGPLGTEDRLAIFRSMTIRQSADVVQIPLPASGAKVGEIHYGPSGPSMEVEVKVAGQRGDTIYNYWKNQTAIKLDLLVQLGVNNSFRLQLNTAEIVPDSMEESFDGIDKILSFKIRGRYDATDLSPFLWTFKSQVAAYLV